MEASHTNNKNLAKLEECYSQYLRAAWAKTYLTH